MSHWFGPKAADDPGIGEPCPICECPFREGDVTGLVAIPPANEEKAEKDRQGRPYTARAREVHRECMGNVARAFCQYEGMETP